MKRYRDSIEFATFPIDDSDYCLYFTIPTEWAINWITKYSDYATLEDFLENYTWDVTYFMRNDAQSDNVIISEENA